MQRAPWDDEVAILSAENVFFEIETAGLAARFGAVMLDMLLQFLVWALLSLAGAMLVTYILPLESWAPWMLYTGSGVYLLLVFLITYAYYFFFEWLWDGQTPGKRALRLRVMQTNGMPITYWHALMRNVVRVADFLPMMYGVGATIALLDQNNRRAGDYLAGTIVACERGDLSQRRVLDINSAVENFLRSGSLQAGAQSSPATLPTLDQEMAAAEPEPQADAVAAAMAARLNAQDYELARDFLKRRDKLPEAARKRLADSLATRLAAKLEVPVAPEHHEQFLQEIAERLSGRF